ncbi:ORF2 [Grizzly bear anellovirus 9]|nr:ORF2 [Grizzly bear anellovirus 9]
MEDNKFKEIQRERWLVSIQTSHSLWCYCEDYRQHIPGWPGVTVAGGSGGAAGAPGEDGSRAAVTGEGEPSDADLAAVCFDLGEPLDIDEEPR